MTENPAPFFDPVMGVEVFPDYDGKVRVIIPSAINISPRQARRFAKALLAAADAAPSHRRNVEATAKKRRQLDAAG